MKSHTKYVTDQAAFLRAYPTFAETGSLDDLRGTDYARLDEEGHVYLDYTGGGLYGAAQLRQHFDLLQGGIFGNPHSQNPTSMAMTHLVDSARAYVFRYFNASPDEYFVIFTPNASGGLKHIGESYPFGPGDQFLLTADNHNSVNGIREFARSKGAATRYIPVTVTDLRLDREQTSKALEMRQPNAHSLFAFPAQSNFTGVQHPLELIDEAHEHGWDVLLDAAAYVPTSRLDLGRWKPDFVTLSFYKMFGYPTGVGCLLVRKPIFAKLQRPWFAGGTVRIVSAQGDGHYLATDEAAFEDGTIDYANLPAVEIGLRHIDKIGIDVIHERVHCLTGWLLSSLAELRHSNGEPLVLFHGPKDLVSRGGTISLNFVAADGAWFDIRQVEILAGQEKISLRTGCFCNPGAGEIAHELTKEEISAFFHQGNGMNFEELRLQIRQLHHKEVGAIRISVGIATNFADVDRFIRFAHQFLDKRATDVEITEPIDDAVTFTRDSA